MKKIVVLSGAGISAESGLKTFRDADGLWEGHDVMEVASKEGWLQNQENVLAFYNARRKQLHEVEPNIAHTTLTFLEQDYEVVIITQNVDDLHERAGSTHIIHLHGELRKVRSSKSHADIKYWEDDINLGDVSADGSQTRPHIVWFGEAVPMMENAVEEMINADYVIIVGTSMQVYPAAGLVDYAPEEAEIFYIDPSPTISHELRKRKTIRIIEKNASEGVPIVVNELQKRKS